MNEMQLESKARESVKHKDLNNITENNDFFVIDIAEDNSLSATSKVIKYRKWMLMYKLQYL